MNLPAWATEEKYEFDLGMPTCCYECGDILKEGQMVFRDKYDSNVYICSEKCVKSYGGI